MKAVAARMLVTVLVIVLVWVGFVWLMQRQVLFPRHMIAPGSEPGEAVEVVELETDAGGVEGWFLPGAGVSEQQPGPAVMFAHGNAELIDHWPGQLEPYRQLGVSVLLVEYRGYGRSAGSPSEAAIVSDFTRFYNRLAERADVDGERIVFHGRSLGGAALAVVSQRREPAAMVLESTFTSTAAMARRFLVPRFLIRDRLDALAAVRAFDGPVLILHGEADTIVPPSHARRLDEAAADSRLHFYDVGHNDPPPYGPYWSDIEQFLAETGMTLREQTQTQESR